MISYLWHNVRRLWRAPFFSPKDFVRRAVFISLAFLAVHLAGLKDFTTILNGTMGSVDLGWQLSAVLGVTYIFAWLAFVILVPMLLIAAGLLSLWNQMVQRRTPAECNGRQEETLAAWAIRMSK